MSLTPRFPGGGQRGRHAISTQHPPNYPDHYIERVSLDDGRQVLIRPIRPDDARLLQAGFARLSAQTIYMRFFEAANGLSDEQAREMATVDYHDRMALVGEIDVEGDKHLIFSARYSVVPGSQPRTAEAAIVVGDNYQSQGLGKLAMDRLIRYASEQGVEMFTATMHTSNQRILNFVTKSGYPYKRTMLEPGVWEYKIFLKDKPESEPGQ